MYSSMVELKSKKIMFVNGDSDVGGAGKMMKYVVNATSASFASASLVEIYSDIIRSGISENVKVFPLGVRLQGIFKFRFNAILKIRKIIKCEKPDIVLTFVNHEALLTLLATIGLPTIVCSAEREDPFSNKFPWNILYRLLFKFSDFGFFQLPLAKKFYYKRSQKGFIIPNVFIPNKHFKRYEGVRKKTIVAAGRFVPDKGFDILIKSFEKVHSLYPDYKLIIYGNGPCLEKCQLLAVDLGLNDYIFFPGYVKDLAETIKEDGMFVLSSFFEGIPNSLIEALSTGIPCISTDCTPGGPRYLSKNGKNILLVPTKDKDAIAKAIIYLIENPAIANKLSLSGPEILLDLTDEKIKNQWLSAFKHIINMRYEKTK